MLEDILNSYKLQKILIDYKHKDLKFLKKQRDKFYEYKNLFNQNKFEIGDIVYTVNKYNNKEHNVVTPCKIMSNIKTTTRNKYNFIDVKILNKKSKNGKENLVRLYFLDYNVEINDNNFNMIFTNRETAQAYSDDYNPFDNKMYKIDKKRLKKIYETIDHKGKK